MNELLERLKSQAGLSHEQAEKAVNVVAGFLEERVSGEQLQSLASHLPGLSGFSDKIPADAGDKLGGALRGFLSKKDD
jgi:uncharacterized protein (DUF2267 family)